MYNFNQCLIILRYLAWHRLPTQTHVPSRWIVWENTFLQLTSSSSSFTCPSWFSGVAFVEISDSIFRTFALSLNLFPSPISTLAHEKMSMQSWPNTRCTVNPSLNGGELFIDFQIFGQVQKFDEVRSKRGNSLFFYADCKVGPIVNY